MSWWMPLWELIMLKALISKLICIQYNVDDVAPPTVKLSDAKCHALLLSIFFIKQPFTFWCQ
jgi:hypothetical protein